MKEFIYHRKGKMTVTEYVAKFNELSSFAPSIVLNDRSHNRKFMLGLREDVAVGSFLQFFRWVFKHARFTNILAELKRT